MPIIKIKTGSGVPAGGSLEQGELAFNNSANALYVGNASGNPVKIVGTFGAQESNSVSITGGTMSNVATTATSSNLTALNVSTETLWYDEGADCRSRIGNWNYSTVYNMTDCAGLGNCWIHGWDGSARTYQLNLSGIPSHTEVMYECLIHMIDSWDGEQCIVYTTDNAGSDVSRASWNKIFGNGNWDSGNSYGGAPYNVSVASGATAEFYGNRYYSYMPWSPGAATAGNGYMRVNTGWYSHSASTLTAKHYTGLDQPAADEAYYISHVRLWIRGGNQSVNAVTTSSGSNYTQLITEAAAKTYADSYTGTLKNLYTFTSNGTYTKSGTDVKRLRVICVGGGGGGRGYHEAGGAGGYAERLIDAQSITSVSITVGTGSAGGYYFGFSGQGNTTSFGSYCSAAGGHGANANRSHAGGHGGLGYGGAINLYGGGGTGHAAGYNNVGSGMSGEGGASFFGGGTAGRHGGNTFSNLAAPGAGGSSGAGNHNGCDGYTGIVLVYEYK